MPDELALFFFVAVVIGAIWRHTVYGGSLFY